MAESELGVLASQCLDRRIPDKQEFIDQVDAWVRERNKTHAVALPASNNTNEADIGEQAYTAIYNRLLEVGLLGPNDESFGDVSERLRIH